MMNILFLTKYGKKGGSSRYMVYNMLDMYVDSGINCKVVPLFDDDYFDFNLLERPTNLYDIIKHLKYFINRTITRIIHVLQCFRYDAVVFEKELLPYFPFGLERVIRLQNVRIIVLFDDAVYSYYRNHPSIIIRMLCRNKIDKIIEFADHVIVWNQKLGDYAKKLNENVSVVNTAIDIERYRLKNYDDLAMPRENPLVIGWIGTPNSFPFIREIDNVFGTLSQRYNIELRVISSQPYNSPNVRVTNYPWSLASEVDELLGFDIGIMPLPSNEWASGKSGVKALQYMSVGIPAVCSPVGMNADVIQDGENGMLAWDEHEWIVKLSALIESRELRMKIGLKGRYTVEKSYTKKQLGKKLIEIFKEVIYVNSVAKVSHHEK